MPPRIARVLEMITDGLVALDAEDCCVYVNHQAAQLLGRPREELLGLDLWAAFLPRWGRFGFRTGHRACPRRAVPVTCEGYAATLGMWFESQVYPSAEGLLFFYFRDITGRKSAEEECDRYFKRLNPAWQKTLGFSEAELFAAPILEFVHPEDRAATLDYRGKISQGTLTPNFENRYRCRDGSYRWLQWNTVSDGQMSLKYGVAHDNTERKQAEAALAESEKRFRTSVDAMEEGLALQDADGSILPVLQRKRRAHSGPLRRPDAGAYFAGPPLAGDSCGRCGFPRRPAPGDGRAAGGLSQRNVIRTG